MGTIHDLFDKSKEGDKEAIIMLGLFECNNCFYHMDKPMDTCPRCGHKLRIQ